jgi:aspartate racemase
MVKAVKKIGVLGGMSPYSTLDFFERFLLECREKFGAFYDHEYPHVLVYSVPVPDFLFGIKEPEKVGKMLCDAANVLEKGGADVIVVPCNTAHFFIEEMRSAVQCELPSMVGETVKKVKEKGHQKVGLLSTGSTSEKNLYGEKLEKEGVETVRVGEANQKKVHLLIEKVMGKKVEDWEEKARQVLGELGEKKCTAVILGCTELGQVFLPKFTQMELVDSLHVLVEIAAERAYGRTKN